jgi:HNH endonuclease
MSTETMELRRCIYCEHEKSLDDFSLEHIFPQSWGGRLCSDLFKTHHVCGRCNSLMGIFVDGAMIRNWFTSQAETNAYRDFVVLEADDSWAPYTYIGPSDFLQVASDEVLEIWGGYSGEHIYHIHQRDDPRYDTFVGGDPIKRKKDPGRAYLYITNSDPKRIGLTLRSFAREFSEAKRYAGNLAIHGQTAAHTFVHEASESVQTELNALTIKIKSGTQWKIPLKIDMGFEQRFLAKMARGLGFNIFGARYLDTQRAVELKGALWEQDYARRSKLLGGVSFLSNSLTHLAPIIGVTSTYALLLKIIDERLILCLTMPSGQTLAVVIADSPELLSDPNTTCYREGNIYIVVPQIDSFIGPVSLPEFIAYKQGLLSIPSLTELEQRRKKFPSSDASS